MDFENTSIGPQTWRLSDTGDGPAVVFLHGFPDTPGSWEQIAAVTAESGYRVLVPYLRGYHRDTLVPSRPYRAVDLGHDVIGLLDSVDVDTAVIVGHDWGATAAYQAARLAPGRVRGLVPIAVPHPSAVKASAGLLWQLRHFLYFKSPAAQRRSRRNDFAYIESLYDRWAPAWSGPDRERAVRSARDAFSDPEVLRAAIEYYRDLSLSPARSNSFRLACPGLLVAGSDDFAAEAHCRSLEKFDGAADLWMVEGAGHWPHREREPEFVARLLAFVNGLAD